MIAAGREFVTRLWRVAPDLVTTVSLAILALALSLLAPSSSSVLMAPDPWPNGALDGMLGLVAPANTITTVIAVVIGALLSLVLPGYALLAAVSENGLRHSKLGTAETILLTLALSIVLVILAGLFLNVLPWGLTGRAWGMTLALLTLGLGGIGAARRMRRRMFEPRDTNARMPPSSARVAPGVGRDIFVLAVATLVTGLALGLGGLGAPERLEQPFTQLWALPEPGRTGSGFDVLRVGVHNQEGRIVTYRLRAVAGNALLVDKENIHLSAGEEWQMQVLVPVATASQPVDILLFSDNAPDQVYRRVRVVDSAAEAR